MKKTQLSKAIAFALSGAALSLGAMTDASAASTTMYNMSTAGGYDSYQDPNGGSTPFNSIDPTTGGTWGYWNQATDGWTNGGITGSVGDGTGASKWVGTSGANNVAFGYTGAHLNWGAEFTGGGSNTATISYLDAFNRYGVYADIDTAKGAWSDNVSGDTNGGIPPKIASGWRHDLEMGLFKTDTAGIVTLSATGILQSGTNFGFTIFKGMDTVTTYNHHGAWNSNNNATGITAQSTPWVNGGATIGTPLSTSDIVAYSVGGASPSNLNTISFNAEAGQIYSIFLGGYRNGAWGDTNDGYALTITQAAPVPVPGAAWLFGGAIASLVGANRRKRVVPA